MLFLSETMSWKSPSRQCNYSYLICIVAAQLNEEQNVSGTQPTTNQKPVFAGEQEDNHCGDVHHGRQ